MYLEDVFANNYRCILFKTDFEELGKAYDKSKKVIEKENQIPRFFLRCLVELEDFVSEVGLHFIYQHHLLEISVNKNTVLDQTERQCIYCVQHLLTRKYNIHY